MIRKEKRFSLKKRIQSFKFAFNGLKIMIQEEHNARIHLFSAICVAIAGLWLKISVTGWIALVLVIGFVITLEIINSTIENVADFISPEKHETIKKIKDLSAAGVLIGSITAFITGILVFLPKILEL